MTKAITVQLFAYLLFFKKTALPDQYSMVLITILHIYLPLSSTRPSNAFIMSTTSHRPRQLINN